jgi:hypothetical protein
MNMLLENSNAVIYGVGGDIGVVCEKPEVGASSE